MEKNKFRRIFLTGGLLLLTSCGSLRQETGKSLCGEEGKIFLIEEESPFCMAPGGRNSVDGFSKKCRGDLNPGEIVYVTPDKNGYGAGVDRTGSLWCRVVVEKVNENSVLRFPGWIPRKNLDGAKKLF